MITFTIKTKDIEAFKKITGYTGDFHKHIIVRKNGDIIKLDVSFCLIEEDRDYRVTCYKHYIRYVIKYVSWNHTDGYIFTNKNYYGNTAGQCFEFNRGYGQLNLCDYCDPRQAMKELLDMIQFCENIEMFLGISTTDVTDFDKHNLYKTDQYNSILEAVDLDEYNRRTK